MSRHGWADAPTAVRTQVERLAEGLSTLLGPSLRGVYLHGSLALGCFNADRSDVDLLVVTARLLAPTERATLGRLLLERSAAPSKLELHVLTESQLRPWRHPAPFDLHYGESLRKQFESGDAGTPGTDRDLAAHVWIARRAGIAVAGPPADQALPGVPQADYVGALLADLAWCRTVNRLDYAVLSTSRIWATLAEGGLQSKDSGASWALERAPARFRPLVREALVLYRGKSNDAELDEREVRAYIAFVGERVEAGNQ